MQKIICIGEALIDMICTDKGKSLSDGANFLKKPGGAPTNVAAAIAALGGHATLVAKVGNDPFGQHLINVMSDFGVHTQFMFKDEQHFTTIAYVSLMLNGERDFVFSRGADGQLDSSNIENIPFAAFPVFHFGSATGFLNGPFYHAYKASRDIALAQNAFISFDPNYRHDLFKNNIPFFIENCIDFITTCNFFKLSDEEAMLITNTKNLDSATQKLCTLSNATFAITLGHKGTLLCHNKEQIIVPSIPITPVDTTGAGDAFVGALLYQLAQKNKNELNNLNFANWQKIVHNANIIGAKTCEHLGAMEAFKHLNNTYFES
jgi:fructokinase